MKEEIHKIVEQENRTREAWLDYHIDYGSVPFIKWLKELWFWLVGTWHSYVFHDHPKTSRRILLILKHQPTTMAVIQQTLKGQKVSLLMVAHSLLNRGYVDVDLNVNKIKIYKITEEGEKYLDSLSHSPNPSNS
jgi:hypothetical protein